MSSSSEAEEILHNAEHDCINESELLEWVQTYMPEAQDITTFFSTGYNIIEFLRLWTEDESFVPPDEEAEDSEESMHFIDCCLTLLRSTFKIDIECTGEDFVVGNKDKVLRFLWSISELEWDDNVIDDESVDPESRAVVPKYPAPRHPFDPENCDLSDFDETSVVKVQSVVRSFFDRKRIYQPLAKALELRNKVVREIYDTEASYVNGLNIIIEMYLEPLKKKTYLSHDQLSGIFGNLLEIQQFASTMLSQLQERVAVNWHTHQTIGDIFLTLAPFIKMYQMYFQNYDNATEILKRVTTSNPKFQSWLNKIKEDPRSMKLPLEAFLITPIQRVPRYILLLRDLRARTWPEHPDYLNLSRAQASVEEKAKLLNQLITKSEFTRKVLEIQSRLVDGPDGGIVTPSRVFIREAEMKECHLDSKDGKAKISVTVFLFNDALLVTSEKKSSDKIHCVAWIPLSGEGIRCRVKDIPDSSVIKDAFSIISQIKSITLQAPTPDVKSEWVYSINKQIAQYVENERVRSMMFTGPIDLHEPSEEYGAGVHGMTATIVGTEMRTNDSKKPYVVYLVQVTSKERNGPRYLIRRRYREFDALYHKLKKEYKDLDFVPLPKKHLNIAPFNIKDDIVESRRITLETFLEDLLTKPEVCSSSTFVIFLQPSDDIAVAEKKAKVTKLKRPKHLEDMDRKEKEREKAFKKEMKEHEKAKKRVSDEPTPSDPWSSSSNSHPLSEGASAPLNPAMYSLASQGKKRQSFISSLISSDRRSKRVPALKSSSSTDNLHRSSEEDEDGPKSPRGLVSPRREREKEKEKEKMKRSSSSLGLAEEKEKKKKKKTKSKSKLGQEETTSTKKEKASSASSTNVQKQMEQMQGFRLPAVPKDVLEKREEAIKQAYGGNGSPASLRRVVRKGEDPANLSVVRGRGRGRARPPVSHSVFEQQQQQQAVTSSVVSHFVSESSADSSSSGDVEGESVSSPDRTEGQFDDADHSQTTIVDSEVDVKSAKVPPVAPARSKASLDHTTPSSSSSSSTSTSVPKSSVPVRPQRSNPSTPSPSALPEPTPTPIPTLIEAEESNEKDLKEEEPKEKEEPQEKAVSLIGVDKLPAPPQRHKPVAKPQSSVPETLFPDEQVEHLEEIKQLENVQNISQDFSDLIESASGIDLDDRTVFVVSDFCLDAPSRPPPPPPPDDEEEEEDE